MRRIISHTLLIIVFLLTLVSQAPVALADSIGVIMTSDISYYQDIHKAFLDSISGYLGQKGTEIVIQKPMPDPMSWTNAARKLTTIGSKLIVSYGAPATLTTMKVTSEVPIVFAGVYDPESMNMTGKNATGISSTVPIEEVINGLNEIVKLSKLTVVFSKSEKDTIIQIRDLKKFEGSMGFKTELVGLSGKVNKDELKGADAILLTTCSEGMLNVNDIIGAARENKTPTAALIGGGENAGIMLTLAADPKEQGEAVAEIVKQIIEGKNPSDITVKNPKKTGITVNKKEAKGIGLDIPAGIISKASRVIE